MKQTMPSSSSSGSPVASCQPAPNTFQRRPAPEVDVEVLEVLGVRADAPLRRRHPAVQRRGDARRCRSRSSRPAPRLVLVGRIADDDRDRLLLLDLVRRAPRHRDRLVDLPELLLLDERVAERVGDEQPKLGQRRLASSAPAISAIRRSCATANGPNCISKPINALRRRLDRAAHRAGALVVLDRLRRSAAARRAGTCRCRPRDRPRSRPATAKPGGRSNSGPRSASSTRRTIALTTSGGV